MLLSIVISTGAATAQSDGAQLISTPDFEGWQHAGAGHFDASTRSGQVIYTTRGGMGLLWYEEELDDFEVTFRFKVGRAGGNSGVFLRVPDGNDPRYVNESFEVQIDPGGVGTSATGAIYDVQPPLVPVVPVPGRWYHMVIRAEDTNIRVYIDDMLVNYFEARRGGKVTSYELEGHLGLQNHSDADVVRFRGIRLRDL